MKKITTPGTLTKLKAIVHMQKERLALKEDEYRAILYAVSGKTSAACMNYFELSACINAMNRMLIQYGKPTCGFINTKANGKNGKFIIAVKTKAKKVLGSTNDARLKDYLAKMQKTSLEQCNHTELRRIMGFLSTLEKKHQKTTL